MGWFIGQSLVVILLALLLGLLLGWLIWGRRWAKVTTTRTEVLGALVGEHERRVAGLQTQVSDRDARLTALGADIDQRDAALEASRGELEECRAEVVELRSSASAPAPARRSAFPEGFGDFAPPIPAPGLLAWDDDTEADAGTEQADGGQAGGSAEQADGTGEPQPEPVAAAFAGTEDADADDPLERIEGIGPKMGQALRASGIRTFQQLAECSEDDLRAAVAAAGLNFAPSLPTWATQSALLADGDEDGFRELTDRLAGGRDEGGPA